MTKSLRQEITDICFETGSVSLPMVNKLEALIDKRETAARIDEAQGYHNAYIRSKVSNHKFLDYSQLRLKALSAKHSSKEAV